MLKGKVVRVRDMTISELLQYKGTMERAHKQGFINDEELLEVLDEVNDRLKKKNVKKY